jgi:hypothetical protein
MAQTKPHLKSQLNKIRKQIKIMQNTNKIIIKYIYDSKETYVFIWFSTNSIEKYTNLASAKVIKEGLILKKITDEVEELRGIEASVLIGEIKEVIGEKKTNITETDHLGKIKTNFIKKKEILVGAGFTQAIL